jgi:hypothetical protein
VERRFADAAGRNTEALTHRGARRAWLTALVLVSIAGSATAKPKRRDAKAAFDSGIAAYKKTSFAAASEAFAKSFELEVDVDTLFAWAQSERKLDNCKKASELYEKLLTFPLPDANKTAVEATLAECRQIIAQQTPPEPPPAPPPEPPPVVQAPPPVVPAPPPPPPASRAWYKDPVALTLVGSGIVATGVGGGFLYSARSKDKAIPNAANYKEAMDLSEQAKSRQTIGLITASAGGALIVGGVVWIVMHRGSGEQHTVTGWLAPGGGGLAVTGAF